MDRLKKEFVLNLCVVSFLLSFLYSVLIVKMNNPLDSGTPYVSDPGEAVVLTLFFLILYVPHLVISLLSYAIIKQAKWSITKRLFLFNGIGLALLGILYFIFRETIVFFLIFSFVVFSAISILNARKMS